jgi:tetratricopeptide (TPR) repeat protein
MKLRPLSMALILILPACAFATPQASQPPAPAASSDSSQTPASESPSADTSNGDKRADAFFNFTMGHYYEQQYEMSSRSEDADKAIDYYKKAFELDPASDVIGEQLAEMYFQAQRIRDAVLEAQTIIQRDPKNTTARRLLARIYVRTLGDLNDTSNQPDTVRLAIEQYTEILKVEPTDTESALWLARLYRLSNQTDQAEATLRTVLAREPENEAAMDQLTQLLLDQKRGTEAVTMLQGIVKHAPTAHLYDLLGDAYTQQGDAAGAETAYRSAVELDPDEVSHLRGLAQSLLTEEKYSDALEQYLALTNMDSSDPENYLRLAEIYRQLHQLDKAEQAILEAKQRAPGSLEVIYYEASIYEAEARFDDAIRVLSDAVASEKAESDYTPSRRRTLAILYEQLGQLYREAQNYTAAVNTFSEMVQLGPEEDRRAQVLLIDTYRAARDLPHALETARKAATTYPDDRDIRANQALLYGENDQTEDAVAILRKLLDGNPEDDLEIQLDLAQVYQEARKYTDAEQAVHAAEPMATKPAEKELIGFLMGGIFERQKKYDQAETEFKTVLAMNPNDAATLNYYGYMLADRDIRLDEATKFVQRALAEDPNNPAYLDSLGWAYYKQNKLQEAEQWLRKAVNFDSHDPTILGHLADVYFKSGKTDLAAADWQKSLDEWHHAFPADVEPDKIADTEQKLADLKRHVAQHQTSNDPITKP